MKSILKIFILPLALLTACVDSLDDYNIDQKQASTVTAEPLFSSALKSFSDIMTTPNVNSNNFRLYAQQWTTTQYLDEPRYVLNVRLIPQNFWNALYRDVLSDLNEARRILDEDQLMAPATKNPRLAQIGIMEAYTWLILVNTFGDIPYSEALDPDTPLPKYDDAQTIYLDVMTRLDESIALMTGPGFVGGDFLYKGDQNGWVRFGNSVKLKMAMVLADNPETAALAETVVIEAVGSLEEGETTLILENSQNARFPYMPSAPNNNPISANLNLTLQSRRDFVGSNTLIDVMNSLNDPRRPYFFDPKAGTTEFIGGYYGYTNNPVEDYSEVSAKVKALDFEALLLDASEIHFLLAEAMERGIIEGGSAEAENHYNLGITRSIEYWTEGGSAATYLSQPQVAYTTAEGDWRQKIGTQKWIALYNRGWDAWVEWRRLDYPRLVPPSDATAPKPANQDRPAAELFIPVRMIYPINEQTLNPGNRGAAASAIGGDMATTKLFWDVY